ncbi:DUF2298 domain-containing protein [Chitinilyticum piscinae]|uniref:Uncharacterized protein n=1 Tax=Chitinilyticum piscinae TaxID=2866724 RepID=A0A8J7K8Y7_9NEIS|nr:DUF2298 domain-containing protein [Chitinilyticum piscinae]MBE9610393.1 hypothetical protein [Chitinilyticum piscinae]
MNLIYFLFTLLLLVVNLAGLTALVSRWIGSYALARSAGVLLFCLGMFFLEHFLGLGKLTWLWPMTTAVSVFLLYAERQRLLQGGFLRAELVFVLAFAYGIAWKWMFPIIYPTSERVTDLFFIGNYLPGAQLPPLDHWFPPNKFDFYYAFQHYAAALMGRIFGMGPGLTYNIAFALLMALPITLAWDFAARFLAESWKRWLVVITFTLGGTGATPFVHLSHQAPANASEQDMVYIANDGMWASQRFIGLFDQRLNTQFGHSWFPNKAVNGWEPRELPSEDFGYQYYVGDYHPPLGGFFLLLLAIAAIGVIETARAARPATESAPEQVAESTFLPTALLAMTVPVMIATNTWTFPLQGALVLGWIAWRYLNRQPPCWRALIAGGLLGFLLLYPFLAGFAAKSLSTPIKLVTAQDHTPFMQFMAQHWPILLFGALALWQKETRRMGLLFAVVFLGLLLISELIYVDDPTGGRFERTNTTMKWWGWIWSGAAVALSVTLLMSARRWVQAVAVAALLLINLYAWDVARYVIYTNKDAAGKMEAHSVYTRDATVRDMFRYLEKAPYGIVLENWYGDAYTDSGIYAVFAVKPSLLGWPSHLMTWHGSVGQAWALKEQIRQFYAGTLADSADWLIANKVEYIVWNYRDHTATPGAWALVNQAIGGKYAWIEFQQNPENKVGLWVRRK